MTVPEQENTASNMHNRAVVCVISGLTAAQAEHITSAIIHEKNNCAPDARGTIATGKEQNISRMIGNGQDAAFESQPPKKKKKKRKNRKKTEKIKQPTKINQRIKQKPLTIKRDEHHERQTRKSPR